MKTLWVTVLDAVAVAVGIAIGLWTSSMTYASCGGVQLCTLFETHVFAAWESVVFGMGALAVLVLLVAAIDRGYITKNIDAMRLVYRWLSHDTTRTEATDPLSEEDA